MASITIREVDNTLPGSAGLTTNAVYVPGLATQGPVGVPTYCATLAEFQSIFGDKPYRWTSAQAYPEDYFGSGVA